MNDHNGKYPYHKQCDVDGRREIMFENPCDTLDFDTYAIIVCNRVILLNIKKLEEDGFDVTGCKWFKNGIEQMETNTVNVFSFAEGSDKLLETAPNYYSFRLITKNYGELPSSNKIIIHPDKAQGCTDPKPANNLLVYPNPVRQGSLLTLEGVVDGGYIYIYNYIGACVLNIKTTDTTMKLALDFPQGIYLIRNEERIVKIVIVQ